MLHGLGKAESRHRMGEPYMFFGFLIFIVFPLWAIYQTAHKGHSGLALLTFLSMFVGLGPVVAVFSLWRTAAVQTDSGSNDTRKGTR